MCLLFNKQNPDMYFLAWITYAVPFPAFLSCHVTYSPIPRDLELWNCSSILFVQVEKARWDQWVNTLASLRLC